MVRYGFFYSPLGKLMRVSGSFFTTGRLIYVAGREGYLPALFGRLHPTRQTPQNAMFLQAGITITFILLGGGFRSLINFAVVASWAFYFLTVRLSASTSTPDSIIEGFRACDFENQGTDVGKVRADHLENGTPRDDVRYADRIKRGLQPLFYSAQCVQVSFLRRTPNKVQIALFLLYMPIIAAPLEALAVLSTF